MNLSKLRGDKVIEKELWLNIIKNNIRIISTIGKMSDSERKIELEDIA